MENNKEKIIEENLKRKDDKFIKDYLLVEKVSNTEKLAGLVLKILKWLGIVFVVLLIIDVLALILFTYIRSNKGGVDVNMTQEVELQCSIEENDYIITIADDGYFNCSNCSKELQKELKDNYIDFGDIEKTSNNIIEYFENNNGTCE